MDTNSTEHVRNIRLNLESAQINISLWFRAYFFTDNGQRPERRISRQNWQHCPYMKNGIRHDKNNIYVNNYDWLSHMVSTILYNMDFNDL